MLRFSVAKMLQLILSTLRKNPFHIQPHLYTSSKTQLVKRCRYLTGYSQTTGMHYQFHHFINVD